MKAIIYLLAGVLLTSFATDNNKEIDGIWLGYYSSNSMKEKVMVKFSAKDKMEFYTGGVYDDAKCNSSYRVVGDSLYFTYTNAEGRQFIMTGQISRRKNYVDGVWKSNGKITGRFYLDKQDVEEKFIQP